MSKNYYNEKKISKKLSIFTKCKYLSINFILQTFYDLAGENGNGQRKNSFEMWQQKNQHFV